MTDIALTGLDGSNPLAFIAALGVLVAIDERRETSRRPRLAWRRLDGWRPVLTTEHRDVDAVVATLDADRQDLVAEPALHFSYAKGTKTVADVKARPEALRDTLVEWVKASTPGTRRTLDWFTSFACEGAVDNNGAVKPTALHFTAGNQQFLKFACELVSKTTPAHLRSAIVGPWMYDSKLPVMGWDNTETRDYALRATNPSNDKKLGNPGADWLALRGLRMMPVAARSTRTRTPGVRGGWKSGRWVWPLWDVPLGCDGAASVVCADGLHRLDSASRARRGIVAVFETRILRSDQGGNGSVTPAQAV